MEVNKITVQLFKLCQAFDKLTKDQKYDVVRVFDTIKYGAQDHEYIKAHNFEQIEGAILENAEVFLNEDVLRFFVKLGERLAYYHYDANDVLLKLNKKHLLDSNDILSGSGFNLINTTKCPIYCTYRMQYAYEFVQAVQVYDYVHGLETANIPQWILDIPVTNEELAAYKETANSYAVSFNKGNIYILRKGERDHRIEYHFKVYNNSLKAAYMTIQSKQKGLQAEGLGAGYVQRVKDLNRQLELIRFAYECECERYRKLREQKQKAQAV